MSTIENGNDSANTILLAASKTRDDRIKNLAERLAKLIETANLCSTGLVFDTAIDGAVGLMTQLSDFGLQFDKVTSGRYIIKSNMNEIEDASPFHTNCQTAIHRVIYDKINELREREAVGIRQKIVEGINSLVIQKSFFLPIQVLLDLPESIRKELEQADIVFREGKDETLTKPGLWFSFKM